MKNKILSILLPCAIIVSSSMSIYAKDTNQIELSPTGTIIQEQVNSNARLSPTTVSRSLYDEWTEIHDNHNITDVMESITNNSKNPGPLIFQIEAIDKTGATIILHTSGTIYPGSTWISPYISSRYKKYIVYARTPSLNYGEYSITYDDL